MNEVEKRLQTWVNNQYNYGLREYSLQNGAKIGVDNKLYLLTINLNINALGNKKPISVKKLFCTFSFGLIDSPESINSKGDLYRLERTIYLIEKEFDYEYEVSLKSILDEE